MAINCVKQVYVLTEQALALGYHEGVSAIQTTPTNILVTFHAANNSVTTTEISAPAQGKEFSAFEIEFFTIFLDF